jgi:type IV secretory pathway VirB9-like protein
MRQKVSTQRQPTQFQLICKKNDIYIMNYQDGHLYTSYCKSASVQVWELNVILIYDKDCPHT